MRIVDLITKKRNGGELSKAEIDYLVQGYVSGAVSDYQAAAWCMAVFFRGMSAIETTYLTEAMAFSGQPWTYMTLRHTQLTIDEFKRQLRRVGLVIAGQTLELAPADGKLYALRDVTGTVPSLPLIASSIMAKNIASGADAIVLDFKVGHGAFMETEAQAVELAKLMLQIGGNLGRKMTALIGDMNQPLGLAVGNALEVEEAMATQRAQVPRFRQALH